STIKCYVCDGELDCSFPVQRECPPNNECFTVADSYNPKSNGLRKGCTTTCDISNIIGKLCRTCKTDLCNARTGMLF
uniref:Uncharacterized protein n=1 Tax=Parascaris equorum TaxID=6256 RepID=A0A914RXD5_PAREQ